MRQSTRALWFFGLIEQFRTGWLAGLALSYCLSHFLWCSQLHNIFSQNSNARAESPRCRWYWRSETLAASNLFYQRLIVSHHSRCHCRSGLKTTLLDMTHHAWPPRKLPCFVAVCHRHKSWSIAPRHPSCTKCNALQKRIGKRELHTMYDVFGHREQNVLPIWELS